MPHELETFTDGTTAFASARLSAWHQLGTVTEDTMKAEEIMAAARLGDWGVRTIRTVGIDIVNGVEVQIPADDKRMTVRRNPVTGATEYLGIVGTDYTVVQNEQCAEMLDRLVDQVGGAHFETAGSLRRGKSRVRHHETARRDGDRRGGPHGPLPHRHHLPRRHSALRVDASPIRVVCANTQRAAFAHAVGHYTFRHTSNVNSQISQAREALGLMWKYMDTFEKAAERMLNTEADHAGVREGRRRGVAGQGHRLRRRQEQRQTASRHAEVPDPRGRHPEGHHGHRWAGYQAITEYLDHFQPAKNDLARANRVLTGNVGDLKVAAFDLLKV